MTEHGGRAGRTPNHLVHETSPYLLQHAYNPVEWHPWGDAALARAKAENKPILISIGYSACHWCHVMERECFEDPEIAALMNAHFVNIKVDREERPDLDHIYQLSAQMLGGGGGWPLNVFLTPDQRPFYAGTYFPPQDKYGRPGFPAVLTSLAKSFREQPERVAQIGAQITLALSELEGLQGGDGLPGGEVVERAVAELKAQFDDDWGGFGVAPKFPYAENLALFLTARERLGDEDAGQKALHTLRCMAEGGIYDQLGGGFHRYSTDDHWLVPHFEKMLYDNALLTPLYVEAYRITGDPFYADVVRATLAFVERELTHPDGAFYSTLDADSEGEEGRFYVWTPETVREALAADDAELALARYGVTRRGNFEMNTTVLSITASVDELALQFKSTPAEIRARLAAIRAKLLGARAVRVRPGRDEKVLVNWNGLMISAFAQAAVGLNEPAYAKAAARAADFIFARLWDGRTLQHSFLERPGPAVGFLDDYAFLAQGLLDLYRATWELPHLKRALELTELTLTR
ncbi:MAG TPA: thioredoxin domain-containing protein, partial [Limnochordia bacterium]|nr:thioredoxin domain-containing protein [Limnochordia bacterium]